MKGEGTKGDIVLVDDAPDNLRLLVDLLGPHGYRVRPFTCGAAAWRAVRARTPDLILLDVTMPGWDGYEVCRRLKADERTRDVPVVFLSALEDALGKVKAFEAGGIDYVTKPFQPEEVLARVEMHLDLARHRRALADSYHHLRSLEQARDTFIHMVAHDLRSPLWSIELALAGVESALGRREPAIRRTLQQVRGEIHGTLEMIAGMLELSRLEQRTLPLRCETFDCAALARAVVKDSGRLAGARRLRVTGADPLPLRADPALVRRVLQNLVGNAVKFTDAQGSIEVALAREPTAVCVEVRDDGVGLDAGQQAALFSRTGRKPPVAGGRGYGIGLAFVQAAVEAHGGTVGVRSRIGEGSNFWFTLPTEPAGST